MRNYCRSAKEEILKRVFVNDSKREQITHSHSSVYCYCTEYSVQVALKH